MQASSTLPDDNLQSLQTPEQNSVNRAQMTQLDGLHSLMILSDSALPLGSFAFSSGLESCLAHQSRESRARGAAVFHDFLRLSIDSVASAVLPFVVAGHQHPEMLEQLDNDLDASTPCTVARRASLSQGRALLTMWDRSLKANFVPTATAGNHASKALSDFSQALKAAYDRSRSTPGDTASEIGLCGHLAPLFGALAAAMSLDLIETIHLFLLNYAKTLLSAAIRASVIGPYQSQSLLASHWLRDMIRLRAHAELQSPVPVEDAGQSVPILDIWTGRHEIIYSRIFNS